MLKSINHFYNTGVPDKYIRVEYIQPTGNNNPAADNINTARSFIDTGYIPNNNTKIILSYTHNIETDFGALFGGRTNTNDNVFGAWIGEESGGYFYPHYGDNGYDAKPISGLSLTR
jgi:hypothetical protein